MLSAKGLAIAAAILGLASGLCLSLGVLTPALVRATGLRFAEWILRKPRSRILEHAHNTAFARKSDLDLLSCLTELSVAMLTAAIAAWLTVAAFVVLSTWAFAISLRPGYAMLRWVPVLGALVLVGAGLRLSSTPSAQRPAQSPAVGLGAMIKTSLVLVGAVAVPVWRVLFKTMSLFTIILPRLWYRALKGVHARGAEWTYAATGVILLVVSFVLQMISIALSP